MTTTTPQTPTKMDWRFPLTVGLSIGIGVPLARNVVPALFPSLVNEWAITALTAAAAGIASGIVGLLVIGALKLFGKSKFASSGGPVSN